ncbi:MAG: hypothetical protein HN353_02730 [Bdellovibrionales bacterium]|jgi:hypothetical protein|nr:hypothetical protein [Bdellovibrionales bacterium]MBT3525602.1 hypothetical protein [Bdellovibrionales bacterium]
MIWLYRFYLLMIFVTPITIISIHFYRNGVTDLDKIGTFITGVAALIASTVGIEKFIKVKNKKISLEKKEDVIKTFVMLRSFIHSMYNVTCTFALQGDPDKQPNQPYPDHLREVRKTRMNKLDDEISSLFEVRSRYDTYLNKEGIDLFDEVLKTWKESHINFELWANAHTTPEAGNFWKKSYVSKEVADNLESRVTEIIRRLNPNYGKSFEDLDFQ